MGEFTEWSEWSACQECGDEQMRTRRCKSSNICFGHDREMRACPCKSFSEEENNGWSCWTDFTECSAMSCHAKGVQKRTRKCMKGNCKGQYEEIKSCMRANCTLNDAVIIEEFPALTDRHLFAKAKLYFQRVTFSFVHLVIASILAFLMGSVAVLLIIYAYFRPKSRLERNLFCSCCCAKNKRRSSGPRKFPTIQHHSGLCVEQHISSSSSTSSSDHHSSEGTETGITDVLNLQTTTESTKYCLATSDSSCTSAHSNHSKEYFTIGNRFDPVGLSSLLNDVIPDDDDENASAVATATTTSNLLGFGTLSRAGKNKNSTSLNLPNKSFNTYTTLNRNSNNNKLMSSGVAANEAANSQQQQQQQQQTNN